MNLRDLKQSNPKAYEAYIELLVEDCYDEFEVDLNGNLTVKGTTATPIPRIDFVMKYDEKCTAMDGPWQLVSSQERF